MTNKEQFLNRIKAHADRERSLCGEKQAQADAEQQGAYNNLIREAGKLSEILDEIADLKILSKTGHPLSYSLIKNRYGENPSIILTVHFQTDFTVGIEKRAENFVYILGGRIFLADDAKQVAELVDMILGQVAKQTTPDLLNPFIRKYLV